MTTIILEETSNTNGTGRKSHLRGMDGSALIGSVQKKWRDSFVGTLTERWDVTTASGVTATNSGGVLTIASGTTAGGYAELLSKETFTVPFRVMFGVQSGATRQANTHHLMELVSVDPVTGLPDGKHSIDVDIGGAASTTVTQAVYGTQNSGLTPLLSAASTIVSTTTYSALELEPFADEAYWHSRTIDSTGGRANSYVRHQQIPDPTALFKVRIRSMNHAAWKTVTGAVAGTGNVIRLTITAHGYATSNVVWVEALNGVLNGTAAVRGNYTITSVDANTIELQGTTFAGAYVTGSGRVALAAAPSAISLQFQFVTVQDYAELTAEITAGRGQIVPGQSMGVAVTSPLPTGTATIGAVNIAAAQTLAAVTSANLGIPGIIADVASAALTTTTTTAAFTPTFGSAYTVNIPVTAVTGTTPTLDVSIEESDDTGTNWFKVYDFPRITAAGMYRSPLIRMVGNRVRYVQTVGGTTPSFTRAINRLQSSSNSEPVRQLIDRSVVLTTLNSTTPSLDARDTGNRLQLVVNVGAITTTAPALQMEGSDDNGASWYSIGSPLTAVASSTVQLTVADVNSALVRARVSTAGVGVTAGYVMVKAHD